MTVVTCDYAAAERFPGEPKGCGEQFRSASLKSVIPEQLAFAGWRTRIVGGGKSVAREKQDLCPVHARTLGVMEVASARR